MLSLLSLSARIKLPSFGLGVRARSARRVRSAIPASRKGTRFPWQKPSTNCYEPYSRQMFEGPTTYWWPIFCPLQSALSLINLLDNKNDS